MSAKHVFISHATADDAFVHDLRLALEGLGHAVWVDSRNLRGGDVLAEEIEAAIRDASGFVAVLSPQTVNSSWVKKEIDLAQAVQSERPDDYRLLPLLLPGMKAAALGMWFDREPLAVPVEPAPGKLAEALAAILAGLDLQLPDDEETFAQVAPPPADELILELRDPAFTTRKGVRRAKATATLVYKSADPDRQRNIESRRYTVSAPLGPIELEEIRWYLEEFFRWPVGVFRERAERTEAALPGWGGDLYQAAVDADAAQEALSAWRNSENHRRFSVWVDSEPPEGVGKKRREKAAEAASEWLSLPWELLRDEGGYLLHGARPVPVRRRLPNRRQQPVRLAQVPIRILLVSPRPEKDEEGKGEVGYIDHRASALPLVAAVENLGELAQVTVLTPPTLPALEEELARAKDAGEAYAVVHFDGHGVFDRRVGLGALLFEHPGDADKLGQRRMQLVHAEKLAAVIRDHGIPLVFLEACQTAQVEDDPTASVAARLLNEGVSAVAAMRASVLVETARRFVEAFYGALALGKPVGQAMLAGQKALEADTERGVIMGAGTLRLDDWFVPVLYQEEGDPPLFSVLPSERAAQLQTEQRRLALGDLPDTPEHHFVGRSRELLRLERLLAGRPYAVLRGTGGAGKTTLAVELARWLARSGRSRRVAFASLEHVHDDRALVDALGQQLLPDGKKYSVAEYPTLDKALQPVERALRDHPTVIVIDNVESVLGTDPSAENNAQPTSDQSAISNLQSSIFNFCSRLLAADPATRLIFTSRERLPAPFDDTEATLELGRLSQRDAVSLVEQVMAQHGWTPPPSDDGRTPEEVAALVEAVAGHARALVLLAPEVARAGVRAATADLHGLMAELERRHPGSRENSLYASVELSLRRLPPQVREVIRMLAVFHGGANLSTLAMMLSGQIESEAQAEEAGAAAMMIAQQLSGVGLAEMMDYGYLRLDPALPPYLAGELSEENTELVRARWAAAMMQLVGFLYEQKFKDAQLQSQLTLLELPNLLALLDWLPGRTSPEQIVNTAGSIEEVLANLGRPAALARAVAVREGAAKEIGDWSHARYLTESANVDRLLQRGDLRGALQSIQAVLELGLASGERAFPEAAYDIAMIHWRLGHVLHVAGQAGAALPPLAEAQRRFQALADARDASAARMAAKSIDEQGGCAIELGKLDEAAEFYVEAAKRLDDLDDRRGAAVSKGQLGTVRMLQERYGEALAAWEEARALFEGLGEPRSVATAWHQIGMVHKSAQQFEAAERAYREGLSICVQHKLRSDEGASLTELGNLYDASGRPEQAVPFYLQGTDIAVEMGDLAKEGLRRSNIASTLRKLGRNDEARREILRAIECKQAYGHAASPWTSFDILHDIEQAAGNGVAAAAASRQARDAYLAYRLEGGYAQSGTGKLGDEIWNRVQQDGIEAAAELLKQVIRSQGDASPPITWTRFEAILAGSRDPALADDPELYYGDSAELLLLLERLGA